MTDTCPHCGKPLNGREPTVEILRRWCRENGRYVTADGCVYDDVAAQIVEVEPETLGNWRLGSNPKIPFHRAARNGRSRYRLEDLAAYLDKSRHG